MDIRICGLQKTFGHGGSRMSVLQNINLDLRAGEFLSLVALAESLTPQSNGTVGQVSR